MRVTSLFLASALLLLPGLAEAKQPVVELTITIGGKAAGKIKLQLDNVKAPKTTANFIKYVKSGHYDGTIFHRVIDDFMIQGGGFTTKLQKKPTRPPIKNEAHNGLKNKRGTIAMARTPNPHSAAAQFFINVKDNDSLDHSSQSMQGWGYCVFGKVVKGMNVVDKIRKIPTGPKAPAGANVPVKPVVIKKAAVL